MSLFSTYFLGLLSQVCPCFIFLGLFIITIKKDFFLSLKKDEFKRVVSVLEDAILATDLAIYFKRRKETFNLLLGGGGGSGLGATLVNNNERPLGLKRLDWTNEHQR
jgi:uncharacterized membrane protein